MYADWAYYTETFGGQLPRHIIDPKLKEAAEAVDALTFSRINAIGFDKLTPHQRQKVQEACCVQAEFLHENADAIESAFTEYSINGVTMKFGNPALYTIKDGLAISTRAYSLLRQTGLASLIAYPREVGYAIP